MDIETLLAPIKIRRVSDEKLASAIAWFEADARPNATSVTRGDLALLLRELQDIRDSGSADGAL